MQQQRPGRTQPVRNLDGQVFDMLKFQTILEIHAEYNYINYLANVQWIFVTYQSKLTLTLEERSKYGMVWRFQRTRGGRPQRRHRFPARIRLLRRLMDK